MQMHAILGSTRRDLPGGLRQCKICYQTTLTHVARLVEDCTVLYCAVLCYNFERTCLMRIGSGLGELMVDLCFWSLKSRLTCVTCLTKLRCASSLCR